MQQETVRRNTQTGRNPYAGGRRPRYRMRDRQSFVDILGTVLRYVLIVVLIMVIIRASDDAYNMGYEVFSNDAMAETGQGQEVTVTITADMSDRDVGDLLQEDGLIKDARVFPLQVRLSSENSIVPGTYTLSTEMTTDEILDQLTGDENSQEAATEADTQSDAAADASTSADAGSSTT